MVFVFLVLLFLLLCIPSTNEYDNNALFLIEKYELVIEDEYEVLYDYYEDHGFTGAPNKYVVTKVKSYNFLDNYEFTNLDGKYIKQLLERYSLLEKLDSKFILDFNLSYKIYEVKDLMLIQYDDILIFYRVGH
jgi:hypothetical protein